jgi:prevent-host-death family protein
MVKKYSIAEARDNFTSMVHEAEEGARVELTRRGRPVAVLVGAEDFERLSNPKKGFWQALQDFRRSHDLADIDPDEIWGDVRGSSTGRDFEW